MMTDYKALCAELVAAIDASVPYATPLLDRARDALAEPELEGPTDPELLELMPQQFRDDLATVSRLAAYSAGEDVKPGLFRVSLNTGALDFARAILDQWGHPALRPLTSQRIPKE
jgi:hypothetical protein